VLLVVPSSLRYVWKNEVVKWLAPSWGRVGAGVCVLTSGKNKMDPRAQFFIISYELVDAFSQRIVEKDFKVIICDESHYIKNHKAGRTLHLVPILRKTQVCLMLTGTPALSRPLDLFTQLNIVAPKLFPSLRAFAFRYCDPRPGFHGHISMKGATNLRELHVRVKEVMIRRKKVDVLPWLPKKHRSCVRVKPNWAFAVGVVLIICTWQ
jgi:SWI/SNF-related matrix-associated actin-dependent regulator 1 of chromatin subfamily A